MRRRQRGEPRSSKTDRPGRGEKEKSERKARYTREKSLFHCSGRRARWREKTSRCRLPGFFFFFSCVQLPSRHSRCSHPIHTRHPGCPACGFRLEIEPRPHKKKAELYFALWRKKILTLNQLWHCRLVPSEGIIGTRRLSLGGGRCGPVGRGRAGRAKSFPTVPKMFAKPLICPKFVNQRRQ